MSYSIRVVDDGSMTDGHFGLLFDAANLLAELIAGPLSPVNVDGFVTQGLVVYASAAPIDGRGGILGQAAPTGIRSDSGLPAVGVMSFDSADLFNLEASGQLLEVFIHELLHVMGIGTIQAWYDRLDDGAFNGLQTVICHEQLGGSGPVPVEMNSGQGSDFAHWSEFYLDNELMTPSINSGRNPVSVITIAALGDIGYMVDLSKAQQFILPIRQSDGVNVTDVQVYHCQGCLWRPRPRILHPTDAKPPTTPVPRRVRYSRWGANKEDALG